MNQTPVSKEAFLNMLRQWIVGFHGDVAPMSEEKISERVSIYEHQEKLFYEKVRFLLTLFGSKVQKGIDIGSSAGGLSVALAQHGVTMEGIEPSQPGVEVSKMRAARLGLDNVRFQKGVGELLPFPDNSFDLVVSLAVLEHVENVPAVVQEAYRVLKPGGYVYFEVPNNLFPFECHYKMLWIPMMPKKIAKHYVRLRGAFPNFLDHLNYMNRWIIRRHFKKVGFCQIKDLFGTFLTGKARREPWSTGSGRLARNPWAAPFVRMIFDQLPTALFINRAVYLIAQKPNM